MNAKTQSQVAQATNVTTANIDNGFDEEVSTGEARRPYALLEDESRIQVVITSFTALGNESFRGDDGKVTESYKISLQMTSSRLRKYEDGGEAKGNVEFNSKYTFSMHEKSKMVKDGLLEALGADLTKVYKLNEFAALVLGKVVSGRVKHRKYKTKEGVEAIAQDLEAFKVVKEPMDTEELILGWRVPFTLVKKHPDKMCLPAKAIRVGGKAQPCASWQPADSTEKIV